MSAKGHRRKAKSGLSQDFVLLTGEREENAPFSMHLITNEPLYISVEQILPMLRFEKREKSEDLGFKNARSTSVHIG